MRGAALVLLLLLVACTGAPSVGEQRADQARDLAVEAGLPGDVADVLATAAGLADATYRVTYEEESGNTITVTAGPAGKRVDVTAVEAGGDEAVTRAYFALDDGAYTCRQGADRWFCAADEAPAAEIGRFADADVSRAAGALAEAADEYDFRVDEREIAGTPATCLVTERAADAAPDPSAAASGTLCISAEGVPLLVEQSGDDLRATAYSTDVPNDALELPVEPDDPPDSTVPPSVP